MQPKGLNRLAKVDFGHQCLREENPSFIIGYFFRNWNCLLLIKLIYHVSVEALTTGRMVSSRTTAPPADVSPQ